MKTEADVADAYTVFRAAMDRLNPAAFTAEECARIEGAADALNWALNKDDDLGAIFRTNIEALRQAVSAA